MAQRTYLDSLLKAIPSIAASRFDLQSLAGVLAQYTGSGVDHLYNRLGTVYGPFFPGGWGDLRVVNYHEDIQYMKRWPPQELEITWKVVEKGRRDSLDYTLLEGAFKSPCSERIYNALPVESRTARVQLLLPDRLLEFSPHRTIEEAAALATAAGSAAAPRFPLPIPPDGGSSASRQPLVQRVGDVQRGSPACVVHLPATGDQGFGRRLRLAFPLLHEGICSMVLEGPYYGSRKPAAQIGSKLSRVSDLLALGAATIYESMCLLHWLQKQGFGPVGMTGLSMGGVHACMTAGMYPMDVACTALLAPRSAAVAYCDGAMRAAMAWEPLLRDVDERNADVSQVVADQARAVGQVLREATYALEAAEVQAEALSLAPLRNTTASAAPAGAAPAAAAGAAPATAAAAAAAAGIREQQQGQGPQRNAMAASDGSADGPTASTRAGAAAAASVASEGGVLSEVQLASRLQQAAIHMGAAVAAVASHAATAAASALSGSQPTLPTSTASTSSRASIAQAGQPAVPSAAGEAGIAAKAAAPATATAPASSSSSLMDVYADLLMHVEQRQEELRAADACGGQLAANANQPQGHANDLNHHHHHHHHHHAGRSTTHDASAPSHHLRSPPEPHLFGGGSNGDDGGGGGSLAVGGTVVEVPGDDGSGPFTGESQGDTARGGALGNLYLQLARDQDTKYLGQQASRAAATAAQPPPQSPDKAVSAAGAGHADGGAVGVQAVPQRDTEGASGTATWFDQQQAQLDAVSYLAAAAPYVRTRLERGLKELSAAVYRLQTSDTSLEHASTVRKLKRVLETYTDITRYPRPCRPDAAVLVAATDDAYVSLESVRQLHSYWEGSEMRLVSGGHVSAFLLHQDQFRAAIRDSLVRVAKAPAASYRGHLSTTPGEQQQQPLQRQPVEEEQQRHQQSAGG